MAHKTLINGTAYKINNGKARIGGTSYKIKNGKTLVNGTVYNIGFTNKTYTITITRASSHGSVWINGVQYNYITTITVPEGTQVHFQVIGTEGRRVNLNGNKVSSAVSDTEDIYIHTVTSNLTVECNEGSLLDKKWGVIHITEQ